MDDTIFALSSGILPSGIAVIRLSGAKVPEIVMALTKTLPPPKQMRFTAFTAQDGRAIDYGLVVFFPSPKSFTGEDCAEFHLHGSKAVVTLMMQELGRFSDCRQAEAGEFSRRAFAQGKLDLTQAEALADLIAAETESQHRLAMMGASGALADLYRHWRGQLIHARALIEAELDFADEADVPGSVSDQIWQDVAALTHAIKRHIEQAERAAVLRDGLKIVIIGAPNAGKSSLINRLAGRDVAIVTQEAGTTRDALEVRLVIAGLPVVVSDTAGLRETSSEIEKMGIDIACQRMQEADLVLLLEDMSDPQPVDLPPISAEIWPIGNKCDKVRGDEARWPVQISAQTGVGEAQLLDRLEQFCQQQAALTGELVAVRHRQIELLRQGVGEMEAALADERLELALRAEHLRVASNMLGKITGDIDVEDLLDIIFSQFCIGK